MAPQIFAFIVSYPSSFSEKNKCSPRRKRRKSRLCYLDASPDFTAIAAVSKGRNFATIGSAGYSASLIPWEL
jgi:hypothetical protein